jgi:hypothetical protein
VGGISEGVIPIALREVSVDEHGPDLIKQSPVHALSHPIVLRCVWRGHLMLNTFFLKVALCLSGYVLASSVGAEGLHALPGFNFSLGDEHFEVACNLGLLS